MIPFKRVIHPGDVGIDVTVVKRALKAAGFAARIRITRKMGDGAVRELRDFQEAHGLKPDGIYGPDTHLKLSKYFDKYGKLLWSRVVVTPPALARARAMLAFCRMFDAGYYYGGEHDSTLSDDSVHGHFDCSSSTSFMLYHFGLLPVRYAVVSTWFESYGDPGRGKYVTIHANGDHVWTEFTLPEGYFRFDTSPHGDGPRGPRVRVLRRSDSGFVPRHPRGM